MTGLPWRRFALSKAPSRLSTVTLLSPYLFVCDPSKHGPAECSSTMVDPMTASEGPIKFGLCLITKASPYGLY